jgi:hypothetical protein
MKKEDIVIKTFNSIEEALYKIKMLNTTNKIEELKKQYINRDLMIISNKNNYQLIARIKNEK